MGAAWGVSLAAFSICSGGSKDGVICTRRRGTTHRASASTVAPRRLGRKDRNRREEWRGLSPVRAGRRRLLARGTGSRHYPRIRLHLLPPRFGQGGAREDRQAGELCAPETAARWRVADLPEWAFRTECYLQSVFRIKAGGRFAGCGA